MGPAIFVLGLVVSVIGSIMILWRAFRESVLWGLACIFLPFASLVFVATHWSDTRKGFFISLAGTALFLFGAMITPTPQKVVPQPAQEQASIMPTTTTHASFESVTRAVPDPQPTPPPPTEEPVQPLFAQVWADNQARVYYPKDCAKHPENAFLLAKSAAVAQGYKEAKCK